MLSKTSEKLRVEEDCTVREEMPMLSLVRYDAAALKYILACLGLLFEESGAVWDTDVGQHQVQLHGRFRDVKTRPHQAQSVIPVYSIAYG